MLEWIQLQLQTSLSNQFLAGGAGLMILGAAGMYLRKLPAQAWNLFLRYGTVVVDVQNAEKSYDWLLNWLNDHNYGKSSRRISIKHVPVAGKRKVMLVPARGNHWFFYKNRPLWLSRYNDKDAPGDQTRGGGGGVDDIMSALNPKETISIRIVGRDRGIINELIAEAQRLFEKDDTNLLTVARYEWGSWRRRRKNKRPLESIMLPPDGHDLIKDIKNFIAGADWYRKMGIPYRRGYLFHGPPGTGKSSTVETLAGELNLPLYALNLAGLSDGGLEQAICNMNHDAVSILLIEDVDTVSLNRDLNKEEQWASLGTLLNAIDGVHAADNIILVMTTNHPENLDPALVRKGRVDRQIEFNLATEDQVAQAVRRFLPNITGAQRMEVMGWPRPISMAEVQEHLKQMVIDHPEGTQCPSPEPPESLRRKPEMPDFNNHMGSPVPNGIVCSNAKAGYAPFA